MRSLAQGTAKGPPPPLADNGGAGQGLMTLADLDRVAELSVNLLERQTVYSYCSSYYGKRYFLLTIPSIVVTTAISVLGAVWPYDGDVATVGRVIISLLGACATVLTATNALFQYQSKMEIFGNAAQQIDGMVARLNFLTKYRMGERISRTELQTIISGIEDKLNEVRTKVPPIPNSLYLAGVRQEDNMIALRKSRSGDLNRREGWQEGPTEANGIAQKVNEPLGEIEQKNC